MRVFLNVTQENIDNGDKGRTNTCAVARALTDRGFTDVSVTTGEICATKGDTEYEAVPSQNLKSFINVFDGKTRKLANGVKASRKTLQPATFRLDFAVR